MKEYEAFGEMEPLANEPYTIMVKYHEGASRIGGDIHGVMCDLAASETVELMQGEVKIIPLGVSMKLPYGDFGIVVPRSSTCLKHGIMMANSVGIIEPDYCGDGDVWGFVAYAIRDTVIERGTRIAQFMPAPFIPDWNEIIFEEVESMGCADRGGYGSTGERSAEGQQNYNWNSGKALGLCFVRKDAEKSLINEFRSLLAEASSSIVEPYAGTAAFLLGKVSQQRGTRTLFPVSQSASKRLTNVPKN